MLVSLNYIGARKTQRIAKRGQDASVRVKELPCATDWMRTERENEGKAISGVVGYQIVAKTSLKRANAYLS